MVMIVSPWYSTNSCFKMQIVAYFHFRSFGMMGTWCKHRIAGWPDVSVMLPLLKRWCPNQKMQRYLVIMIRRGNNTISLKIWAIWWLHRPYWAVWYWRQSWRGAISLSQVYWVVFICHFLSKQITIMIASSIFIVVVIVKPVKPRGGSAAWLSRP